MPADEASVEAATGETGVGDDGTQQGQIGVHADDLGLRQGGGKAGQCGAAVGASADDLGDHRVVIRGDAVAGAHAGVDAHGVRELQVGQGADGGEEVAGGVFGVEPDFDGVAVDVELGLSERQGFAGGDAELPFDQVLAGDGLGDRVFDLEASVHLHEVEGVAFGDELDGAGTAVVDGAGGGDGGFAHGAAHVGGHAGGGGFLDHLLVAALDGAVALEEGDDVAVGVGEDLDFDVAGAGEVAFDQDAVVADAAAGFALGAFEGGGEVGGGVDHAHAFAAAAGRGLDQDGVADGVGGGLQGGEVLGFAVVAGDEGNAGFGHQGLGLRFAAHGADGGGRRADEDQAGGGAGFGEFGVLGEEAVAGMDRFGAGQAGGFEDGVDAQV